MKIDNTKITSVQVVLYFPIDTSFKSIEVANAVSARFGGLFTRDPNIISLPPNAPAEIPRIMYDENGKAQFNIGTLRADLIIHDELVNDFMTICENLKAFIDSAKFTVFRVAIVATADFADKEVGEFTKEVISSGKILDPKAFDMGWLCQYKIGEINVNKWTRIILSDEDPKKRNIVIDLNTSPEKPIDWKTIKLNALLKDLYSHIVEDIQDAL